MSINVGQIVAGSVNGSERAADLQSFDFGDEVEERRSAPLEF